ncbi:MAG: eCIS core domain-containing protein [Gammaproteobacteria bacterium]
MATRAHPVNDRIDRTLSKRPPEPTPVPEIERPAVDLAKILQRTTLAPNSLRPADLLLLQRTVGNRAVGALLARPAVSPPLIQAKLTVNSPGDEYEREADRVAEQVMRMPAVQREALDEDEEPEIMTKREQAHAADGAFEAGEEFEQQLRATRRQGQPLPASLREEFETKLGADFSGVRIHTDALADQLNQSIQAQAFTTGRDVFFRQGAYDPESRSGQAVIAHELTHVVQQAASGRANHLIQRRVGFEFESIPIRLVKGHLDDYKKQFDTEKGKNQFGHWQLWEQRFLGLDKKYPNLKRKEEVIKETNFTLEADDTAGSNVEFVLHGAQENEQGEIKAGFTFQQKQEMTTAAEKAAALAKKIADKKHDPFYATDLSGKAQQRVIVHNKEPYNSNYLFQATAGIRPNRITKVFSNPFPLFQAGAFQDATVQKARKAIDSGLPEGVPRIRLTNLLTLLITYITGAGAHQRQENIKEITPMMARTDFGRLFSLLPKPTKEYFRKNPDKWVALVCNATGSPLDGRLNDFDDESPSPLYDIVISKWLTGMTQGEDLLKGLDPDKSMGGLGKRTDPGNQPIFEFRHMQPAQPETFVAYCQTFFDYVAKLNREGNVR